MEIQEWREFLIPYEQAMNELLTKFRNIMMEYKQRGLYSPIEQVSGRVKTINSILTKCGELGTDFDSIETFLNDITGIRIICQFVEDIEEVVKKLRERRDMTILEETDYISNPKESGYRSYHVIIEYPVYSTDGLKNVKAEIQIRTLAMNFWAIIEHSLRYKYQGVVPEEVGIRLRESADACLKLDREMSAIREEIMDAQGLFRERSGLVDDILANIKSIYASSERIAMEEAERQVEEMIQKNDFEKMKEFGAEIDAVAQHHRVQALPE